MIKACLYDIAYMSLSAGNSLGPDEVSDSIATKVVIRAVTPVDTKKQVNLKNTRQES